MRKVERYYFIGKKRRSNQGMLNSDVDGECLIDLLLQLQCNETKEQNTLSTSSSPRISLKNIHRSGDVKTPEAKYAWL